MNLDGEEVVDETIQLLDLRGWKALKYLGWHPPDGAPGDVILEIEGQAPFDKPTPYVRKWDICVEFRRHGIIVNPLIKVGGPKPEILRAGVV